MHTTHLYKKGIVAHHNGDYSGDVRLVFAGYAKRTRLDPETHLPAEVMADPVEVEVPFEDLKQLVFQYLRDKKISHLEGMSDQELEEHLIDCN